MPQQPPGPRIPTHGAIDLSGLKARPNRPASPPPGARPPAAQAPAGNAFGVKPEHRAPAASPPKPSSTNPFVVDVTEPTFEADVIATSMQVPVIVDFWADWCEPCKQLSPVLEDLAAEYGGRFVLAKIDVDANQRLAQMLQIQSLPTVWAVVAQQPMPLFQGALPADQVRKVIDEVLKVATMNGISGRVAPREVAADGEDEDGGGPALRYPEALQALANGDLDGAEAAYREALERQPGDPEAEQGLARVAMLRRVYGADPVTVRQAAQNATDVAAQCLAADLDIAGGAVEEGFKRLVETVRITGGADRDAAREHLLGLFLVAGPNDPRVAAARRALAGALF
ncbi:MAG: tetratricopeptide repeat protein [Sporichthyaceae bacterium]